MRFSTFVYCVKQGLINICRNVWFSLASTAIISACIFLFCLFFAIVANVQYMVRTVETTVGVTIFFDENLTEAEIQAIGKEVGAMPEVKEIVYTSPDEAWETFRQEYFKGAEELAAGGIRELRCSINNLRVLHVRSAYPLVHLPLSSPGQ